MRQVLLFAVFFFVRVADAQSCRPLDDHAEFMIGTMKVITASTDSWGVNERHQLSIPAVDSSTVSLVSENPTCDTVLAAFLTTLPADYPKPLPRSIYVVKVGAVYVAAHFPGDRSGNPAAVIGGHYVVLSKFNF